MVWFVRIFSFLFGFMLGISTVSAQLSELEIPQQSVQQRQAELNADQKIFVLVNEQAMLWTRLANAQDEFFTLKWNNGVTNLALQTEMKFIKKELLAREKEISKLLRK